MKRETATKKKKKVRRNEKANLTKQIERRKRNTDVKRKHIIKEGKKKTEK